MKIIKIDSEDKFRKIKDLAGKYNIDISDRAVYLAVEDNRGEIKSFIGLRFVGMIEPMVSEHPIYTKALWDAFKKEMIENDILILRCFAKKDNVKLYEKIGFYEIFEEHIPMEINFYNEKMEVENGGEI